MSIEKFQNMIADLEHKRTDCVKRGTELSDERANTALGAHTGDKVARRRLDEINAALAVHGSELESLDAALKAAGAKLAGAEKAAAQAADRLRAEEARKTITELAEVFEFTDKHLTAALRGLLAIERGVEELHQKDVAFPTAVQLRLGIVAVLGTWLQQLPKMWWNELSAGLRFRAPADRQSAMGYWAQIEPSLRNQIAQRSGEPPPPTKEKAA
jgi:hypothetical protein